MISFLHIEVVNNSSKRIILFAGCVYIMFIFWSLLFTELAALHKCTVISPSLFYALAPKRNCTVRLARDTFSAKPRMLILPDDFLIVFACLLITDYLTGCKHNENWTGLQGNFIHIFTSLLFFFSLCSVLSLTPYLQPCIFTHSVRQTLFSALKALTLLPVR